MLAFVDNDDGDDGDDDGDDDVDDGDDGDNHGGANDSGDVDNTLKKGATFWGAPFSRVQNTKASKEDMPWDCLNIKIFRFVNLKYRQQQFEQSAR